MKPTSFVSELKAVGITGLFRIIVTPELADQSAFTCAAGIVGLLSRSFQLPEVEIGAKDGLPLISDHVTIGTCVKYPASLLNALILAGIVGITGLLSITPIPDTADQSGCT